MATRINIIECPNATSPVNIDMKGITGPCVLKCDYNYEYGTYSPNMTNKDNYLSLNYSGKANPVKYNDQNYTVQEVRIYQPSLHQFGGVHTDGELMIIHNGPGKNLIVCVPFVSGGKTDKGSTQLGLLIDEAALRTPNVNESVTNSSGNFSLDNFVPSRKGYFAYNGTLPYDPCNGEYSYIVYNKEDGLNISSTGLTKLKKIIKNTITTVKKNSVFYNKKGANSKQNGDDIYIDCQPVDANGQILVQEGPGGTNTNTSSMGGEIDMEKLEPFLYVILALGLAVGISYAWDYVVKKLKKE